CPRAGLDGRVLARLAEIVGPEHVLAGNSATRVYECDGFTLERQAPVAVVLPGSAAEVAQAVRMRHAAGIPFVSRGAGTSVRGAPVPPSDAVVIPHARMVRILHMYFRNRRAVVEPGVVNAWISRGAAPRGYLYAPDPSSQAACTIGGNVGTT